MPDERSTDMSCSQGDAARARRPVLILGAAGRDFHNFNMVYRDDPTRRVVAFTAAQIPGIAGRRYPPALAGPLYPRGIAIEDESRLEEIAAAHGVDEIVFAYSDVPHKAVMNLASRALAAGADFILLGPERTMIRARRPVVAVTAVRTGCGKSQISRWLGARIRARGLRAAVLRHPMPYGDLAAQRVQRLASAADLDDARCTAEEREEYEPHIAQGNVVYAGVDYEAITRQAESEADIIVWDGGNNDFPFLRPDLHIVVVDALRPDQTDSHHPGEATLRMADVVVVNKVDAATAEAVARARANVAALNPAAPIVLAASPVALDDSTAVTGRRVLVVEDGPTLTHGGMAYGAGHVAAGQAGVSAIVDPRPFAAGSLAEVYRRYPHIGPVLPAVGYGEAQLADLKATLEAAADAGAADVIVAATPLDLGALLQPRLDVVRARYRFADAGEPTLSSMVDGFLDRVAG